MKARTGRGWAYLGAVLGGGMSIAANIAHSYVPPAGAPASWAPARGAVVSAVFWPTALLVAVEIFARVAWPDGRRWVALKFLGLLPVAAVAAVVSYRHMAGLMVFYREDPLTAVIGPLAVDGLMVMATGALIGTSRTRGGSDIGDEQVPISDVDQMGMVARAANAAVAAMLEPVSSDVDVDIPTQPAMREVTADIAHQPAKAASSRARKLPPSAADKVARIWRRNPDATPAEIAAKAGVAESTARRHLARIMPPSTDPEKSTTGPTGQEINGREPALTSASEGAQL